jgi:signal transduction histidine kinase
MFHRKLESAGIGVRREYETEGKVVIYPSEFRQVFANLITNAIDAMACGGELRLLIQPSSQAGVIVRIADSGCGISPEDLNTIFEPFFTTKGEKGSGIGLWVIKGIVEKIGGRIEVTSSVTGKTGTSFTIFIPETRGAGSLAQHGQ